MVKRLTKIVVAKIFNISLDRLAAFPSLAAYQLNDDVTVTTLAPNFDYIRRRAFTDQSGNPNFELISLNLVVDDKEDFKESEKNHLDAAVQIRDSTLARIPNVALSSLEEFSAFILAMAYPDIKLSDEFWIPVESILTVRELEILHLVYQGMSSKKVATALGLSPRTIELHRQNCSTKIGKLAPSQLGTLFSCHTLETYKWAFCKPESVNSKTPNKGVSG